MKPGHRFCPPLVIRKVSTVNPTQQAVRKKTIHTG